MGHINRNKRAYGAVLAGLAAALLYLDQKDLAALVGMLSAGLIGAGHLPSDAEARKS